MQNKSDRVTNHKNKNNSYWINLKTILATKIIALATKHVPVFQAWRRLFVLNNRSVLRISTTNNLEPFNVHENSDLLAFYCIQQHSRMVSKGLAQCLHMHIAISQLSCRSFSVTSKFVQKTLKFPLTEFSVHNLCLCSGGLFTYSDKLQNIGQSGRRQYQL